MIEEEKVTRDIWAMILSATGECSKWKVLSDFNNGLCFYVSGSKYVGTIKFTSEIEKGTNLIIFHVKFIENDNPSKEVILADVTGRDMTRVMQDKGASVPREAIERFKKEFGFLD